MSENTNIIEKGYELKALTLICTNGTYYDIFPQMIELNIFEDVYSSTMSGNIVISDSVNLFSGAPLSGFEYLNVIVNKKGYDIDFPIAKFFRIYKIDFGEVSSTTLSNQSYILHFCSEEMILSASKTMSKSYRGKTISYMISDIMKTQLGVIDQKFPKENIEETFGRQDIVIPYMNPLTAINWLVPKALSNNGKSLGPNFLFYENQRGFNFKSIESLFKQNTKVKYTYNVKNIEIKNENSSQEYHDVISYSFMKIFDTLSATKNGMFSGLMKGVNLLRLRVDDTVHDYQKHFDNSIHVENNLTSELRDRKLPYSFQNNNEDRLKVHTTKNYPLTKMYPTTLGHNTQPGIANKQPGINPNLVENWLLTRISRINQLNYLKLKLVAPGDTYITVGDIIEFRIPIVSAKIIGQNNDNDYYSGRYLITAIRHIFSYSKYEMLIEATRDCLSKEYPNAENSNLVVRETKKQ